MHFDDCPSCGRPDCCGDCTSNADPGGGPSDYEAALARVGVSTAEPPTDFTHLTAVRPQPIASEQRRWHGLWKMLAEDLRFRRLLRKYRLEAEVSPIDGIRMSEGGKFQFQVAMTTTGALEYDLEILVPENEGRAHRAAREFAIDSLVGGPRAVVGLGTLDLDQAITKAVKIFDDFLRHWEYEGTAPHSAPAPVKPEVPNPTIGFGKHAGTRLSRLPVDYLQWLAKQDPPIVREGYDWTVLASDELTRRGGAYEAIMPSHHAIDRFSTRHLDKWDRSQGIAAFLGELAVEAWDKGKKTGEDRDQHVIKKEYRGMQFVFQCNATTGKPVGLKTVI